MLADFYKRFTDFVLDEVKTARYLFLMTAVGFAAFTLFGDNDPIKGPISHEWVNAIDSIYAFVIFLLLSFHQPSKKRYKELGYSLIYLLNLGNVFLLYGTSFNEQYAYQFIVVYTISGWFFRNEKAYIIHTVTVNTALIITSIIADHNTQASFDFYGTYVIASLAQLVLIRYRFGIEDKLADSERKYRLLAENSFDLICIHNTDGRLEFISPSIKRLLGYEPDELLGRKPYEIVHPDDQHIIRAIKMDVSTDVSLQTPAQYRLLHKDNSYIWLKTIFVPLEDSNEHLVLSQSRDIRRSKRYQQMLEERSKELERSNADLETFAFVSSHDIQEPLRMISNYMQLLKRRYTGKLDADADEYIEYANRGAIMLSQLIRDLLSYSRITRTEIVKSVIDVNELMKDVINHLSVQIKEKDARVMYQELGTISCDRNLILLVFQNLVSNGIKYNQNPKPEVSILCKYLGREKLFVITDNGIGIAPEHQERIFEPFHRLHTKSEYPGTGLGLSICKKIVERHNGKIWLESTPGQGTTFYFTLPE
ncbi:MAG: PAS domain S-box protein [Bacteroidetes bacterium]|nr:PAS domain S-box protein [Bacteroidota bacterium]